jgi:hypothetical protein
LILFFLDTPSSSFETPIDRSRDTPKTMKDDKLDELSSKHEEINEDEEDSDKQSVTSTNRSMD